MYKIILFLLIISQLTFSQVDNNCLESTSKAYQEGLNAHYADKDHSPLKAKDLEVFKTLDFFPIDRSYCVDAKIVLTPNEQPFEMPTTTNRKPLYVKYGILHFEINSQKFQLEAYRPFSKDKPILHNKLFVPFTDLTSGNESYGGGRYLDLEIPENDELTIDFNQCYNPYCAYNEKYSCPLTPAINDLKVEIKAGVKKFKD